MPTSLPPAPFMEAEIALPAAQTVQLIPKANTVKLTLYFDTNPGFLAFEGTEGVALPASKRGPILANSWFEVLVKGSPVFVEMPLGGTVRVLGEQ